MVKNNKVMHRQSKGEKRRAKGIERREEEREETKAGLNLSDYTKDKYIMDVESQGGSNPVTM